MKSPQLLQKEALIGSESKSIFRSKLISYQSETPTPPKLYWAFSMSEAEL